MANETVTKNQSERIDFASIKRFKYPDFLDIQLKSFQDFFQLETKPGDRSDEGLYKTFSENFPNYRFQKSILYWNSWIILLIHHATVKRSVLKEDSLLAYHLKQD